MTMLGIGTYIIGHVMHISEAASVRKTLNLVKWKLY